MNTSRFVILTGHLNDYPISDLVGILRHQRKTGRLLIEYAKGPATLFFYEGDLVDASMNDLTGIQAVCFALAQPPASFNFNPLIQPTQRTIDDSLQRTVSELFGCWDESFVEIPVAAIDIPLLPDKEVAPEPNPATTIPALPSYDVERLALPPAPVASTRRPISLVVMTAAGLITVGVSTAIALSGGFRANDKNGAPTAVERSTKTIATPTSADSQHSSPVKNVAEGINRSRSRSNRESSSQRTQARERPTESAGVEVEAQKSKADTAANAASNPQAVTVVMEIENGRVLRASIANPKPGLDNYEAMALRIARQRRYSSQQSGRETIKIKVSPSDR